MGQKHDTPSFTDFVLFIGLLCAACSALWLLGMLVCHMLGFLK